MLLHGRHSAAFRPTAARSGALRRACALAAAALVPVLAGCEAGNNAPVLQWHPPTNGAYASISSSGSSGGKISIENVFVLGSTPNRSLPRGSSAGMFLALVNTGPRDKLVNVTAPGTAQSVKLPGQGVTLPDYHSVLLTGPAPNVVLSSLIRRLAPGRDIKVVMTFQNAGSVTLFVPVMPRADYYATFSPAPAPAPTPTAKVRKVRVSGTAVPTASGSPAASAKASTTASATP